MCRSKNSKKFKGSCWDGGTKEEMRPQVTFGQGIGFVGINFT